VYKRRRFHLSLFKHSYIIISTAGVRHLVALSSMYICYL